LDAATVASRGYRHDQTRASMMVSPQKATSP
jgi:hypothetical protein